MATNLKPRHPKYGKIQQQPKQPKPPSQTVRGAKHITILTCMVGLAIVIAFVSILEDVDVSKDVASEHIAITESPSRLEARALAARKLLDELVLEGFDVHVGLEVRPSRYGLGVFATEAIPSGYSLFIMPTALMLKGSGNDGQGLGARLLRERRDPSSNWMELYLQTLPDICPHNLAVRPKADLKLLENSIHAIKVTFLRKEMKDMKEQLPNSSEEERRWAMCMVFSRAFTHPRHGTVMMPFVDLLNHGHAAHYDHSLSSSLLIADKRFVKGDEIMFGYVKAPSTARMLTSFGFANGVVGASLQASDLPVDNALLEEHNCPAHRIDLLLGEKKVPTEDSLRASLRCVRLRVYTAEERTFALEIDHLEASFDGEVVDPGSILHHVLYKDLLVVGNTGMACSQLQNRSAMEIQARLIQKSSASEDLKNAIQLETMTLLGCGAILRDVYLTIESRLDLEAV